MGKVSQTFEFNFKFNDNNASKQLKAISNDVKNMLSEMGNASDKMSIFKEMVSYLDQVDRAMSAFKAKNKNAQKYVDQNPFGVPVILQTTLKSQG